MKIKHHIFNESCLASMERPSMLKKVHGVITSPPYNTSSRPGATDKYNSRYDSYNDFVTDDEYIEWTLKIFEGYDNILKENGVVLYNLSYSSENPSLMWRVIGEVINKSNFMVADTIVWKKKSAIPNNRSKNKLTRIVEFVFVLVRKSEIKTFNCNKKVVSVIEKTGQNNYENVYNFIDAPNNNGSTSLNKATYSSELCEKLIDLYFKEGDIIYDSFIGTGTTAIATQNKGLCCIGSEISLEQVEYANNRILNNIK